MARIPAVPGRLNRDQVEVPLKERAATCSPRASHVFEYHQCSVFLPVTLWCCLSTSSCAGRVWHGRRGGLPASHAVGIPLAAEGISTVLCCAVWSHRKGPEAPAGVMSDTMAWSLGHDWCQTRQQLHVAFTLFRGDSEGAAASEVTARPSASPHARKHAYILWEQTGGKDQQLWSPS